MAASTTVATPVRFDKQDIRDYVGDVTYHRGLDYYTQGRVINLELNIGTGVIESTVLGSGGRIYKQEISIADPDRGELDLDGICSCPMGGDCKHVAAVLLQFCAEQNHHKENSSAKQQNSIDDWMRASQSLYQPSPYDRWSDDSGLHLLYILSPVQDGVVFTLQRARVLKKGGYGKPSKVSLFEFGGYNTPAWSTYEDDRICRLLNSQSNTSRQYLRDDWGALALQRMITTGRCYWHSKDTPPLVWGETKPLDLQWQQQQDKYRLQMSLPGIKDWQPVITQPLLYIDTEAHQVGLIDTELPAELFSHLQQMPTIPYEQAPELSRFLRRTFPQLALPLPVELNELTIEQPPLPVLRLLMQRQGNMQTPVAAMSVQYAEYRLAPDMHIGSDTALIERNDQLIRIQRQIPLELQWMQQFWDLGLESAAGYGIDVENALVGLFFADRQDRLVQAWVDFVEQTVPQLEAEGWQVEIDGDFDLGVIDVALDIEVNDADDSHGWFDLALDIDIQGQRLPLLPLITESLSRDIDFNQEKVLLATDAGWLRVPTAQLQPIWATLQELFSQQPTATEQLRLPNSRATLLNAYDNIRWGDAQRIQQLSKQLNDFHGIAEAKPPQGLQAQLRPYQVEGLSWLNFLRSYQLGGILADDMGLGKTLQALAFLLTEHRQQRLQQPALVVAPTSLVWNWRNEAEKFTPQLKTLVLHGADRHKQFSQFNQYKLLITTYPLLHRDWQHYKDHPFSVVILDEAQYIKNTKAKVSSLVRQFNAELRLCLTGTPMENHLGELWSLMDFVLPGLLGQEQMFRRCFRQPIEKIGDNDAQQELNRRIAPFILRRSKDAVVKELPQKTEIQQVVVLEQDQRRLYESIRVSMEKKVRDLIKQKGLQRSHIEFLDALLKLRQVCCDPRLVKLDTAKKVKHSAKLEWLKQTLPELIAEGRRVLIFSQFTTMLGLIEQALQELKLGYTKLTGQTRKREQAIDCFQSGAVPIFLISLKAGGTGLNLTAADTVIHYDPWWNPAVEQQATDRAHRIGQDKPVFVYKLVAEGTVEEKIQIMQQQKRALAEALYAGNTQALWRGSADELLSLLQPG